MNLNLTNKHAFVSGSTQGIGRAAAEELAALGAKVTLIARNEEALKTVLQSLDASKGQSHDYIVADFTKPDQLEAAVSSYLAGGATIHILINNTGGPPGGPIAEAKLDDFFNAYRMHLACNHVLTQSVIPGMKNAGYGRIINVISTSVKEPISGLGVSNTTRGAVASWAKTMAGELGQYGITVNNVLPGFTETERLFSLIRSWSEQRGVPEADLIAGMKANVPAARFAAASEVANVIAFLASPSAGYVNGVNIPVDGGRTRSM